jgi:hypothetical protein
MRNLEGNSLSSAKALTPVKAHRAQCLRCTGGSTKQVRDCPQVDCPSFPYRMGKNPNRKGTHPKGKNPPGLVKIIALRREKVSKGGCP